MTKGERLKLFREYLGLTQIDFATSISTSQPHLSAMENGTRSISAAIMLTVSEAFTSLNLDWLFHGRGDMIYRNNKNGSNEVNSHQKYMKEQVKYDNSSLVLISAFDDYCIFRKDRN